MRATLLSLLAAAALALGGCNAGPIAATPEQIGGFTWPEEPADYQAQIRTMLGDMMAKPDAVEYRIGRLQRGWVAKRLYPWTPSVCEPFWIAHCEVKTLEPNFLGMYPDHVMVAVFLHGHLEAKAGTGSWMRVGPRVPTLGLVDWLPEDDDAPIPPPLQTIPLRRQATPVYHQWL